jgi:hypothetical protein
VLRNELDMDSPSSEGARLEDLVGVALPAPEPVTAPPQPSPQERAAQEAARAAARQPKPPVIDEIRGTNRNASN